MKLHLRCQCAWSFIAIVCLVCVSSAALAADSPSDPETAETVADVGPARQINPVDARARVMLDDIIFRYEHVYFEFDSAKLLPGARIALERKVEWLKTKPARRAIIEGHCDLRGPRDYNKKLGIHRAQAVRTFLIEQGIEPHRIQIVTWGKKRPLVPDDNDTASSWNRRAETRPQQPTSP